MPATLSRRALLGAELPADAEAFTDDGIWIAGVADGSMAARAGLAAGDLLRSIAGIDVRTLASLSAALRRAGDSAQTELVYVRGDATITRIIDVVRVPTEVGASYGAHDVGGIALRTIATGASTSRAQIAVIQGIACESIDHALAPDAPLAGLVAGWTAAGYATLRFDKRGVGDSEGGPCPATDFATELADARAVIAAARRQVPLVVFGHSVGGIIAAAIARDLRPDAIIVYGTPVMRWLACLKDSARRQLALRGASDDEIAARIAALDELAVRGELNGRSAAYHQQLDVLDIEAAWQSVEAPVLVVRGEHDWVVDADDQARIASLARGPVAVVDVPALDHLFGAHADREASLRDYGIGAFDPVLVDVTNDWLARTI